jgi:hypothetical protein
LYHQSAMATTAQINANRMNAQFSTGPKTSAGKAAVAQNHLSHGLSSKNFAVLPVEDPAAYKTLLDALTREYQPETPTQEFLVTEMARAQWKLERTQRLEAEILSPGDSTNVAWSAIAQRFQSECSGDGALLKLNRYEQAARRAWHKALDQLQKLRSAVETSIGRQRRVHMSDELVAIDKFINAPMPRVAPVAPQPGDGPAPSTRICDSKPMPAHLQRELDAHKRRDPLFDPRMDASQMSRELRKWFDRHA